MNIRPATTKDSDVLAKIIVDFQQYLDKENGVNLSNYSNLNLKIETVLLSLLEDASNIILIAEEQSEVVGYSYIHITTNIRRAYQQAFIIDFFVSEPFRDKGIGGKLFEATKLLCKKKNINVIKLTSDFGLAAAHRFYEKHGGKFTEKMYRFDF